jgi:hypothetical protein
VAISSSSLGLCFIPLRHLLHVIFYSPMAATLSRLQSLMEISSSSLVICFIPPRRLLHAIFHSPTVGNLCDISFTFGR